MTVYPVQPEGTVMTKALDDAFSYIRFSTPEQSAGDSLRRQTEDAAAWCQAHSAHLDETTTLHDLGKSAFTGARRKNPDRHALAAFLKLVESGRVRKGSYLIVENLDRLTREDIQPALLLVLNLLQAGVRIVQLKPVEMVFDDKSDTLPVMMMIIELSRGHSESAMKKERNGAKWQEKLAHARAGKAQPPRKKDGRVTRALTAQLPGWVEDRGGKLHLIPERAAIVQRLFALSAAGYGLRRIVRKFTDEGVPAWGTSRVWSVAYLALVLKDRRALGEHQPRTAGHKPDGPPIPGYFPAAVSEREWDAARAGAAQRRHRPGRTGQHVNVFAGLVRNARDGDSYFLVHRSRKESGRAILVNTRAREGTAPTFTFPFATFERGLLSKLREIDPHEILNGDHGPDATLALSARKAQLETSIGALVADMDAHGESPTLMKRVRDKEADLRIVLDQLAEAAQKAAHPLSETWGEFGSLADVLDNAPDPEDARLRLRACLRRMVESMWLLVVPRGTTRLGAVQVWFTGNKRHRDYLLYHRGAGNRRAGASRVWSFAEAAVPGTLDLRKPAHAARLEKVLRALDLTAS
jgi:DNA invertase Pin-like site-specific DNA recombinase